MPAEPSRSPNMATPATCTRFTDEYQLYEELGKYVPPARPPHPARLRGAALGTATPRLPGGPSASLPRLDSASRSAPGALRVFPQLSPGSFLGRRLAQERRCPPAPP